MLLVHFHPILNWFHPSYDDGAVSFLEKKETDLSSLSFFLKEIYDYQLNINYCAKIAKKALLVALICVIEFENEKKEILKQNMNSKNKTKPPANSLDILTTPCLGREIGKKLKETYEVALGYQKSKLKALTAFEELFKVPLEYEKNKRKMLTILETFGVVLASEKDKTKMLIKQEIKFTNQEIENLSKLQHGAFSLNPVVNIIFEFLFVPVKTSECRIKSQSYEPVISEK